MAIARPRLISSCAGGVLAGAQRATGTVRFLENGVSIYVAENAFDTVGVDTEEDVRRVEGDAEIAEVRSQIGRSKIFNAGCAEKIFTSAI